MNKKIFAVLAAVIFCASCAMFSNEAQYDKGGWNLWATSHEVAKIKSDKLAFEKLKESPVLNSEENEEASKPGTESSSGVNVAAKKKVPKGYLGLVANLSSYNRYNFVIRGPETKSFLLGPGEREKDFLVPGRYVCTFYQGNSVAGQWSFRVGPQLHTVMNEKYHWYVYTER